MGLLASDLEIGAFKAEVRMSYDGKVVNLELPGGEIIPPKFLIWAEAPEDRDMVKRLQPPTLYRIVRAMRKPTLSRRSSGM